MIVEEIEDIIRNGRLRFSLRRNWDYIPFAAISLMVFLGFSISLINSFGTRGSDDLIFDFAGVLISFGLLFYVKWSLKIRLKLWPIDNPIDKVEIAQKLEEKDWHVLDIGKHFMQLTGRKSMFNYGYDLTIVEKDGKIWFHLHPDSNRPFVTFGDVREIRHISDFLSKSRKT